jgi:branched-chain amino acid transport system ATP-binding protein
MSREILNAHGLYKSYGKIDVLKNVSLKMKEGETHAVIGPNGAGKTTLFKTLSGEVLPDAGSIFISDRRVDRQDGYQRVRMGVGRTFQVARVFAENTVLENMVVAVEARRQQQGIAGLFSLGISPSGDVQSEAIAALDRMGLASQKDRLAGVLAYGDRKRLELAMSLALQPKLLMLDEPMAGMSPMDRSAAVETIKAVVKERGISVLLTEHDMDVVFTLADHITVLNYGEIIASGSPDQVRSSPKVREIYLGHEVQHA